MGGGGGGGVGCMAAHLWSNMHEGHGLGLAAQGVLQQLGEFGVAERNVVLLGCQGRHDIA